MSHASRLVGQFAWDTATDEWFWDEGMFSIHGYRPGAVAPTTDLVLTHKLQDDRAHAEDLLNASACHDRRFSNYHCVVDVAGRQHRVLVVGESRLDDAAPGAHRLSRGYMVDITQDEARCVHQAVAGVRRSAAPIQQVMGLVMGSLGLNQDGAFALISRISQNHNVKVRDLARRFMTAAVAAPSDDSRHVSELLVEQAAELAAQHTLDAKN